MLKVTKFVWTADEIAQMLIDKVDQQGDILINWSDVKFIIEHGNMTRVELSVSEETLTL